MLTLFRVTVIATIEGKRGELSHDADHASTSRNYTFTGEYNDALDRASKAYKSEAARISAANPLTVRLEELRRAAWCVIREVRP